MASEPNDGSPNGRRRRSSFTDMFARPSVDVSAANAANSNGPRTGSISSAIQSRARRMSITSIGLSGSSPTNGAGSAQASAFDSLRGSQAFGQGQRQNGSDNSEDAVEDADEVPPLNGDGSRPTSPSIQRKLSFGARAYRDARTSSGASSNGETFPGSDGNGSPGAKQSSSPPGARKDGFNWSENLRNRAQRSSISAASGAPAAAGFMPLSSIHSRSKSVADQGGQPPPQPAPKAPPPAPKAPDHFQERILKGDFYMD